MAFGLLTFFRRPTGGTKLLQPGCCKVKVSEKGDIKIIEVNGPGNFTNLLAKKVHILLFMPYLSKNEVK